MNIGKVILSIVAIALGVFLFIYGGYDDSPGAQLLGFLVVLAGVVGLIRMKKRSS
jgi:hypothetical protein